jgi:hypothetical protein
MRLLTEEYLLELKEKKEKLERILADKINWRDAAWLFAEKNFDKEEEKEKAVEDLDLIIEALQDKIDEIDNILRSYGE